MDRRELLIGLNLINGLGPVSIGRLINAFASPEDLFRASSSSLMEILGRCGREETLLKIRQIQDGQLLSEELKRVKRHSVRIITLLEEEYPVLLKAIPDPPPVVYVKGTLLKEDSASVAIVGTRSGSPYGLETARRLALDLARCGITIVSGLAEGIDGASHEGALEAQGRTLAVLGHGLEKIYPSGHQRLAERIVDSGALLTEFPMEEPPVRENFPRRNRVISGLSLGVVVVEAPLKSGALITAREALEQGREVFAVPGPISSFRSQGTHRLLKEGARLVEEYRDILEELAPHLKERLQSFRLESKDLLRAVVPEGLTPEESAVYEAIPLAGATGVDTLTRTIAMDPSKLLALLTGLELKGLIRQLPGQGYARL